MQKSNAVSFSPASPAMDCYLHEYCHSDGPEKCDFVFYLIHIFVLLESLSIIYNVH